MLAMDSLSISYGSETKKLQSSIDLFNKSVDSHLSDDAKLSDRMAELEVELFKDFRFSESRPLADTLDDLRKVKIERAECHRTFCGLLEGKNELIAQLLTEQKKIAEKHRQLVQSAIDKQIEKLESIGCGLNSIPGNCPTGRLADVNMAAAQIQLNHRARQADDVAPVLIQAGNSTATVSAIETALRRNQEFLEEQQDELRIMCQRLIS